MAIDANMKADVRFTGRHIHVSPTLRLRCLWMYPRPAPYRHPTNQSVGSPARCTNELFAQAYYPLLSVT
jgi:hypothetical protein